MLFIFSPIETIDLTITNLRPIQKGRRRITIALYMHVTSQCLWFIFMMSVEIMNEFTQRGNGFITRLIIEHIFTQRTKPGPRTIIEELRAHWTFDEWRLLFEIELISFDKINRRWPEIQFSTADLLLNQLGKANSRLIIINLVIEPVRWTFTKTIFDDLSRVWLLCYGPSSDTETILGVVLADRYDQNMKIRFDED